MNPPPKPSHCLCGRPAVDVSCGAGRCQRCKEIEERIGHDKAKTANHRRHGDPGGLTEYAFVQRATHRYLSA
jgi:hypothetical protein